MAETTTLPQIQAKVASIVGRCYPLVAPDQPLMPYSVYSRVSNIGSMTLADKITIENWRIQIDIYGLVYSEVIDLSNLVHDAMLEDEFSGVSLMWQDLYEDTTRLFRISQDFSFWVDPDSD